MTFVLTELTLGGAEMMLWKLLSRIDRLRFDVRVIALSARSDSMLEQFEHIGVPCESVNIGASLTGIHGLVRLRRALRAARPDIVQGWLYHGNLAATLCTRFWNNRPAVIWNVRGVLVAGEKRLSRLVIWLGAKLSFLPERIINNSVTSAVEHEQRLGYRREKRVVLPNGFDPEVFRPSPEARATLRQRLGLPEAALLVGLFGRYHPVKDHQNFMRAAAQVNARRGDVHYVLAGEGVDSANTALCALRTELRLDDRVHLLGVRSDMPVLTAALDVLVSSSRGEGFSNVVGEAMSCEVPCVVTDVGDSRRLVADTGCVVAPADSHALARGMLELLEAGRAARQELGRRARARIIESFSLDAIVRRYESLYLEVHAQSSQQRVGA